MKYFSVVVAACLVVGCAGGEPDFERGAVSGEVTLNGEPIEDGVIRFVPTSSGQGRLVWTEITNGRYSLSNEEGPPLGETLVEITAKRKTGEQEPVEDSPGEMRDVLEQYIPIQYNAESKVKVNIEPGDNNHDFPLEG